MNNMCSVLVHLVFGYCGKAVTCMPTICGMADRSHTLYDDDPTYMVRSKNRSLKMKIKLKEQIEQEKVKFEVIYLSNSFETHYNIN